jgi:hypothetical protein
VSARGTTGVVLLGAVVALVAGVSACAEFGPDTEPTPHQRFSQDLSVCRLEQPGPTNRRLALSPYEDQVAKCLARRGWLPSGERIQSSLQ